MIIKSSLDKLDIGIHGTALSGFAIDAVYDDLQAVSAGIVFAGGVIGDHTITINDAGDLIAR